jgi:hypothetical protein
LASLERGVHLQSEIHPVGDLLSGYSPNRIERSTTAAAISSSVWPIVAAPRPRRSCSRPARRPSRTLGSPDDCAKTLTRCPSVHDREPGRTRIGPKALSEPLDRGMAPLASGRSVPAANDGPTFRSPSRPARDHPVRWVVTRLAHLFVLLARLICQREHCARQAPLPERLSPLRPAGEDVGRSWRVWPTSIVRLRLR